MDPDVFLPLARALEQEGVEYVLVGGLAMGLQGLARATKDIDIFVHPTEENVLKLRRALHQVYDDPSIEEINIEDLGGDYPVVRYGPPDVDYMVDIISRLGEAWKFEDLHSETMQVSGIRVPVATARTLFLMKRTTMRPQDHVDADVLREKFHLED